jgi:ABC-type bacteriocin/lantibiotic exporter with double-glycine peptidase domain
MTYSRTLRLISCLLAATVAGCAGLSPTGSGLERLSKQAVRLDLPFEAQTAADLCGVASVDMLTTYYKKPLSPGALRGLSDEAKATGGVSGASMKAALEEAGYFVAVFSGTLDQQESGLYHHLDLKRPLLLMTGSSPRHYWVAVGYDPQTSLLILLDPASGPLAMPVKDFAKDWQDAKNFTLLALPEPPAAAAPAKP